MTAPSVPYIRQTAGPGAARSASKRRDKGATGDKPKWITYAVLCAVILISVLPLYYTVLLASNTSAEVAQNPIPSVIPGGELVNNLTRLFQSDIDLVKAAWNSFIVSAVTAVAVVFFSTLAGFAFAKLRFRGQVPLLAIVVATLAVPTQLGVVPLYIVMRELGLVGNLWAVILPGIVTAFGVFWMTQYLSAALPFELIEAARIDGASTFRTFWSIALPAVRPAASMLGLFSFIGAWTNYFWPAIVLGPQNPTLPVALQLLQTGFFKDIPLIMTGVLVSIVPLLVLFLILGKQLVAGVMQGAIKG
ncbi:carbohydrate ABC transporter permease [Clavibacter michiganensis]|uniref:carbohydrate ABC transporter permease n=1 Tax=Clavibacter michiganensis TaxID=28447 RepID=UPI0029311794|nr:carbohydrate ABC transporter permease [Clavibacter michiganensis]